MDGYEQWLRQLLSDLASFASARRGTDQRRALEMIEYSTAMLRKMLDARAPPQGLSADTLPGPCRAETGRVPRFDDILELEGAHMEGVSWAMDDDALERLLLEVQTEPLAPLGEQFLSADTVHRDLEALAWIDEQMNDTKLLAEDLGITGLLPGIALTRAGVAKEAERLVRLCGGSAPTERKSVECRVLPFPARARG